MPHDWSRSTAAHALLAKAYLNKAVYESADRLTFTFDAADMTKVIENCDQWHNSKLLFFQYFFSQNDKTKNHFYVLSLLPHIVGIQDFSD